MRGTLGILKAILLASAALVMVPQAVLAASEVDGDGRLQERSEVERADARVPTSGVATTAVAGQVLQNPSGGIAVGRGAGEFLKSSYGVCRWVDPRGAAASFFVPDKTAAEWHAFANQSLVAGAVVDPCSCPAQNVTLTASTGATASERLASSYSTGDGRPNPLSAYYQGSAARTFNLSSGCETWTERVEYTYSCATSGWQLMSVSRNASPRDTSACPPPAPPEPDPPFSRYEPPEPWTPPPVMVAYEPPPVQPPEPPPSYRVDPPVIWEPPPPPPPVVVTYEPPPVQPPEPPPVVVVYEPPPPSGPVCRQVTEMECREYEVGGGPISSRPVYEVCSPVTYTVCD